MMAYAKDAGTLTRTANAVILHALAAASLDEIKGKNTLSRNTCVSLVATHKVCTVVTCVR